MQMTKAITYLEIAAAPKKFNRRQARRFGVTWPVVIRGYDRQGRSFQEFSCLKNLSPVGACFALTRALTVGAAIEMDVRTPLSRKQWLRYFGRVVYVGGSSEPQTIGLRFDSAKPSFVPDTVVRLRQIKAESCAVH
jgi:PilZ domain